MSVGVLVDSKSIPMEFEQKFKSIENLFMPSKRKYYLAPMISRRDLAIIV